MNWTEMRLRRKLLRVFVLMAGLAVCVQHAIAPAIAFAVEVPVNPYCYSWSFRNYTAIDADGLSVNFIDSSGSGSVSEVYTDTGHPFGTVAITTSVTPSGTAATNLNYGDGEVPAADEARIGFCRHTGDTVTTFAWKGSGGDAQPLPRTLGVVWQWSKLGQLSVALTNQQPMTLSVTSLWLYDAGDGLAPADMTLAATTGLQPVVNLGEDMLTLAPNASQTLTVQFGITSNIVPQASHPYILAATFAPEDDLSDEGVLMLQAFSPQAVYMPLLTKE